MESLSPEQRLIREQRERIDLLEEELRQAKDLARPVVMFPAAWRLQPSEQRILFTLFQAPGGFATHERLFEAGRKWAEGESAMELVRVRVHSARPKLRPFGIEIKTRWGHGYELTAASRAIIKAALEERAAA